MEDEDPGEAVGAETHRRATVLRPLVEAYLAGAGSLESGVWVMPAAGSYSGAYLRETLRAIIVLPMPEAPWTRRPGIRVCRGASIRLCNLSSTRSARGKPIQMSD